MKKIIVNGGRSLDGEITVSGSKNAALPIIFACLLTSGASYIDNLPDIGDVAVALRLIENMGAKVERQGSSVMIDTASLSYSDPDPDLVSQIRASTYLIGACLGRFGRCPITSFGGCSFSHRPIDMHIDACVTLGAKLEGSVLYCKRPIGGSVYFAKASVGATVNAILLASVAEGDSHIFGCAIEPHIDALISFLISCGAFIHRDGRDIHIKGRSLHGGSIRIIGDMIEAGSYLSLGLMCHSKIKVKNSPISDMDSFFDAIGRLGAKVQIEGGVITMMADESRFLSVTTAPYPGFPTDLQPILAPLMACFSGGEITDTVWPGRFGYLEALSAFGVVSSVRENTAYIYRSRLTSGRAYAPDLRGGMACLMAALAASGHSEIYSLDIILRGYENLDKKLRAIGADVEIIDT